MIWHTWSSCKCDKLFTLWEHTDQPSAQVNSFGRRVNQVDSRLRLWEGIFTIFVSSTRLCCDYLPVRAGYTNKAKYREGQRARLRTDLERPIACVAEMLATCMSTQPGSVGA